MNINIYTSGRDKQYCAEGVYDGKKVIVFKGATLNHFRAKTQVPEYISLLRTSRDYVEDNVLLKDCEFSSPSHAALFVTGNISNGLRVWKTEDGKYLRESIKK